MTKKKTEEVEDVTPEETAEADLTPEQQQELREQNEMITFVANNILNSLTLNQAVTVVQQVALRDAGTIVKEADEDKVKEIKDAMAAAAAANEQSPPDAPA